MTRTQIEALLMLIAGHASRGFKSDAAARLKVRRSEISNNLNEPSLAFLRALRTLLAKDKAEGRRPNLAGLEATSARIAEEALQALEGHLEHALGVTRPQKPYRLLVKAADLDEARLRELHAEGLDSRTIAERMGVPWVAVIEWYADHLALRPHPLKLPKGQARGRRPRPSYEAPAPQAA